MPDLIYCPTGGIDAQKAKDYLALADVPCVGGSWIIASTLLAAQDFGKVEQLAREASALGRRHREGRSMVAADEEAVRQAIIGACLAMNHNGINQGTAGNISVRWNSGLLITPSGLPYEEMAIGDIVFMNMDGSYEHRLAASSEWRFHRDILHARGDVNAVVHAHPIHATAFAICGMEIPAVHYMISAAGGPTIRCAPYAPYGTEELSNAVLEALSGRMCALLGNHGMVATGPDLREAMWLAIEVETLCKQYAVALQVGTPRVLEADEIEKTIEKFKDYGPRRKRRAAQVDADYGSNPYSTSAPPRRGNKTA